MGHGGGFPVWWWCWTAFILALIIRQSIVLKMRGRTMATLAEQLQFQPWGDNSLPSDLSLTQSSIYPIRRIFHIFHGTMNGVPVAFFDVAKQSGKTSAYFTVIAARSAHDPFGAEAFDPDLTAERTGEWVLLYRPRNSFSFSSRLLSMKAIQDQLASVRNVETEPQKLHLAV
jgi:hypothetical protein